LIGVVVVYLGYCELPKSTPNNHGCRVPAS
jgi:hypothetical protein